MWIPSIASSPWILRPRHPFSSAIRPIRSWASREIGGRPGPGVEIDRQKRRKPCRCQRITVSGCPTIGTAFQRGHQRERATQKARSIGEIRGRGCLWASIASCCRSASSTIACCSRLRKRTGTLRSVATRRATRVRIERGFWPWRRPRGRLNLDLRSVYTPGRLGSRLEKPQRNRGRRILRTNRRLLATA